MSLDALLAEGQYVNVLTHESTTALLQAFVDSVSAATSASEEAPSAASSAAPRTSFSPAEAATACPAGLAALDAFLQANVTGPVLSGWHKMAQALESARGGKGREEAEKDGSGNGSSSLRRACLASLDTDGVSAYPHMQHVELFCLARWVFLEHDVDMRREDGDSERDERDERGDPATRSLAWTRLRIHTWHYKLLTEPNAGPGSVFNKMTAWSDLPSLQEQIEECLAAAEAEVLSGKAGEDRDGGDGRDSRRWSRQAEVQFLVEKANIYAMLGQDAKAQQALEAAARRSRFEYVLSGALGKRTRFQDKSTSQLVILAKSWGGEETEKTEKGEVREEGEERRGGKTEKKSVLPQALPLNNDTLLETIDFSEDKDGSQQENEEQAGDSSSSDIPLALRGLAPDKQPALTALDQIILLSVATLKDAFSPADSLTLEEILPYATRVLQQQEQQEKQEQDSTTTNWQVYTQALIVRSRIEMHRSRTVERAVLQMQAVVDQSVVDQSAVDATEEAEAPSAPAIEITPAAEAPSASTSKPTTFFPAAKPSEQAPPEERLRYIHALSTPPLWHLESELAFAWAGVGSLVSALEIFQRLRLWAEVALCLATRGISSTGEVDGRGEDKARALLRWQLFEPTEGAKMMGETGETDVDIQTLRVSDYNGPERVPPPANAARLLCILGDIEAEPQHYERAWTLSKQRFARAQRSLGEHYLQQRQWERARDAYKLAVGANRLNTQLWNRLGDIELRLGAFSEAAEAFSRAIGSADNASGGEDARTWSNLASALYSMYKQALDEEREQPEEEKRDKDEGDDDNDDNDSSQKKKKPEILLSQALAAFKRGANMSHDNWRIWDNVVTLASCARPPAIGDIVLALQNIVRIRQTEEAVDANVVRLLLREAVLGEPKPNPPALISSPASPASSSALPRGSAVRAICHLIEDAIVPLITTRSELWALVARERAWRGDYAAAIEAAEKGWRAAMGSTVGGGGGGSSRLGATAAASTTASVSSKTKPAAANWLEDADAWDTVVSRTDELVTMLENYGPEVASIGSSRWKVKARSALRSVLSKARDQWEGSPGWVTLEGLLEGTQ